MTNKEIRDMLIEIGKGKKILRAEKTVLDQEIKKRKGKFSK